MQKNACLKPNKSINIKQNKNNKEIKLKNNKNENNKNKKRDVVPLTRTTSHPREWRINQNISNLKGNFATDKNRSKVNLLLITVLVTASN